MPSSISASRNNNFPLLALGAAAACAGIAALFSSKRSGVLHSFRDKVVLITGSSRGLGLALAEEFARAGAKIALAARDRDELASAKQKLLNGGTLANESHLAAFAVDITDQKQADRLIAATLSRFGQIDVLVNNAGIIAVGPIQNQTADNFRAAMDANFYGTLYCTLAALPGMLSRGSGHIVNITSIGGKFAVPHLLPYVASKFAATGFSQGLHAELRNRGIHVLTVTPGLMRTGSYPHALFSGKAEDEYRWFSLGATLPGISTSAESAARKIVQAAAAGSVEIAITPQAIVAARLAQVAPEITAELSALASDYMLPKPSGAPGASKLKEGKDRSRKELWPLTLLGRFAAKQFNQGV